MKLPTVLDADDRTTLGKLVLYSLLILWGLVMIGLALGLAVRAFLLAKGA